MSQPGTRSRMQNFRPIATLATLLFCFVTTQAGAAEIELTIDPGSGLGLIAVEGRIESGDSDRFYDLARGVENGLVFLQSPGGDVQEGLWIAAEIAYRGFHTVVVDGDGCHSICAVIWVSGAERYMADVASISVHAAYRLPDGTQEGSGLAESGVANAMIGAYLNEIGLSMEAIRYFTIARPDQPLLPITPAIAQRLDIDVHVVSDDGMTGPADRPTPRLIARQVVMLGGLSAQCEALLDLDTAYLRMLGQQRLERGHDLFGGELFSHLIPEFTESTRNELDTIGVLGWCLFAEERLRLQGLDPGISGPSFNCSRAGTSVERAICRSPTLWAMDRAMSHIYGVLRDNTRPSVAEELRLAQREWLAGRDRCGESHSCLERHYRDRLADFGL